jgi:valyl-tRNA synthetase
VVKLLEEADAYRGRDEHDVRVGICERSGAVIEPMLRPQWYLKMEPLAEKVMGVAERDGLKFVPEHPSKQLWEQWLDGIQDWCLSRQIWWGHRIPAYMVLEPSECEGRMLRWIVASNKEAAHAQLTQEEKAAGCFLKQDEDVLDTWFSSGLLPLSTAGWRGDNSLDHPDWKQNYPLSFIESGGDILFFWLARMAMLSTWFSDKLPYSEIILHPLVCDSTGRKMSKSVGNVLDPLLIIHGRNQADIISQLSADFSSQLSRGGEAAKNAEKEIRKQSAEIRKSFPKGIATSGADSLRMALLDYTRQQRQINLELRQIDVFRKLAIKLDNAFKFFYNTRSSYPFTLSPLEEIGREELRPHDLFLLHHSRNLVGSVHMAFETRQLHTATEGLRVYTYNVLSSVYLEFIKKEVVHPGRRRDVVLSVLQYVLDVLLRLYHPFMPFLSESLWQELSPETRAEKDGESIVVAAFPQVEELPEVKPKEFTVMRPTLQLISTLRAYKEVCRNSDESLAVGVESGKRWAVYVEAMWETVRMIGRMRAVEMSAETEVVERLGGDGWDMVFEGEGGWKVWKRGEEGIVVRAGNGKNRGDQ